MDTIGITVITVPIIIIYDYAVLLYEPLSLLREGMNDC